jgi:acylphosphatase
MRAPTQERREISVRGIVQGVGFRPFVYALAQRHGLAGLVRNDAEGVHIEAEGAPEELERFLLGIQREAPPLAVVEVIAWHRGEPGWDQAAGLDLTGRRRLRGVRGGDLRSRRPALPVPVHQLHELRAAVHYNPVGALRPGQDHHVPLRDVPRMPRRVR